MDDTSLGKLRSDLSNLPEEPEESGGDNLKGISGDDIQASMYHQEINTLKIEKLTQRITIISVIIPCIIIAILAFAYVDMKERVVDVDQTQGSHMDKIARTLEEKLNALDVRIAKATFDLDEKLALIEKKSQALENQAAKMSSDKVDLKSMDKAVAKLEKRIKANAAQDKTTLGAITKIKQQLKADIKKNNDQFKSRSGQINDEIQLFKEEFDARLLELSAYEQRIDQLTKNTGLLDKQLKILKQDTQRSIDKKLMEQRQSLEKKITALKTQLKAKAGDMAPVIVTPPAPKTSPKAEPTPPKPDVPPASAEGKTKGGISEQTLTD